MGEENSCAASSPEKTVLAYGKNIPARETFHDFSNGPPQRSDKFKKIACQKNDLKHIKHVPKEESKTTQRGVYIFDVHVR